MTPFQLDSLRRRPDVEAAELVAVDAADRLLLETALSHPAVGPIAVLNDQFGALTLGTAQVRRAHPEAAVEEEPVRVFQDGLVHERALALNAVELGLQHSYEQHPLGASLLHGAATVLLRLPRSLDELDELAWTIATHAPADVRVLAVGRLKHMSLSMNVVLGRYFSTVSAGLARQKSRVLVSSGPLVTGRSRYPLAAAHDVGLGRPLEVRAFGATFGGTAVDPGTRLLLPHLRALGSAGMLAPCGDPLEIIDLGSGNGVISAVVALMHPDAVVHASDESTSACRSTSATAEANGVSDRVRVTRDDALSAVPADSASVVVLNPPFHLGSTVHTGIAHKLFGECARVLAPGGVLLTVWNSHLGYRQVLERLVGPTVQLDRSPRFTVTRSVRRP